MSLQFYVYYVIVLAWYCIVTDEFGRLFLNLEFFSCKLLRYATRTLKQKTEKIGFLNLQ